MWSFDVAVGPVAANHAPPPLPRQHIAHEEFYYEFEDFVDCLLVHRSAGGTQPLDTLRLRIPLWSLNTQWMLSALSNTSKYTSWVRRGLRCSPAALDVSGFVKLPALASSVTRRLTKLRLDRVILHHDFAEHLMSGLPVLEDLEISGTDLSGLPRIQSGTLKHLAVDSSSAITLNTNGRLAFHIVAPRLVSLHLAVEFRHLVFFGVLVQEAPRLVQASIRLGDRPELRQIRGSIYHSQDDRALVKSLCDLLGSLSHVRALTLSGFHDTTLVQQQIPLLPQLPLENRWMQHHLFMQPPGLGIGPPNYMPLPDPETIIAAYNPYQYMLNPYNMHPPLVRPMLQTILEEESVGLPVFNGLTSLVLDECETGLDFETLWRFLHKAPLLEELTLKNCQCQMFPNGSEMEPPQTIFETATSTVSPNLKSVEIMYDDRNAGEGRGQHKVQVNEVSSDMIKWKLPATTMIRFTKLPKH